MGARSMTFALGPERLRADLVGGVYEMKRADGRLHGLYLDAKSATNGAIRLSNQLMRESAGEES